MPNYYNRTYEVYADPENKEYRCACCKFERDGIVCCHILRVRKNEVKIGYTRFILYNCLFDTVQLPPYIELNKKKVQKYEKIPVAKINHHS